MALSGSVSTTSYEGRKVTFSWTATQSIANNSSTINWTLKGDGTGESSWYMAGPFSVVIAGSTVYSSSTRIKLYNGTAIASGSKTITHNNDGSKSFAVSLKAAIYSSSYNCTGSKTFALNNIPRKATVTSAPNFNDEENPTITYSNPAGNNVTSLQACIASTDGMISYAEYRDISKTGSSYTFNLTSAERTALRNAFKNSNTGSVKFYVKTVMGGETYRSNLSKTLTIINNKPTLSPTAIDLGPNSTTITGDPDVIIKGWNNVKVTANATTLKGATIKSQSVTCGSKSINAGTGTLSNVESGTFVFSVTDSRGNTTTQTVEKTLIPYIPLTCILNVEKPDAQGNVNLTINGKYYNGSLGTTNNSLTVQYRYKENDGAYGNWNNATSVIDGHDYTSEVDLTGLNYQSAYTFQARAIDKVNSGGVNTNEIKVKSIPVFDWGENDVNINGDLNVDGDLTINGINPFSNEQKVLWEGGMYMTDTHIIALNEKISEQKNGIVLVFSEYSSGVVQNYMFNFHFIPKHYVSLHAGAGVSLMMTNNTMNKVAFKYLYIFDNQIKGHANNNATGTGSSGIAYTNNSFVLRYVIGV